MKTTVFSQLITVAVAALALAACAATGPAYSTASSVDGRTHFALQRSPGQESALEKSTLEALYSGFKSRGFVPSRPDQADFLVSYHLFTVKLPPHATFSNGWAGPAVYTDVDFERYYFPGNLYVVNESEDGDDLGSHAHVFLLSIRDSTTGKVLWRGWQTYDSARQLDPQLVHKMVDDILAQLPSPDIQT